MESKTREQEDMNPMAMTMGPQALNNLRGYPYYIPNMKTMQNYPQMSMFNNIPQMNGYLYQMEIDKEEPPINLPTTPENQNTPKNQNLNSSASGQEKQKFKSGINLLINSANKLIEEGIITKEYLNQKTETKPNHITNNNRDSPDSSTSPSLPTTNNKKSNNEKINNINNTYENGQCENPLCKYIFNSNKNKLKIKIKGLKPQEKYLCKKCSDAVENGHFCYYCNAIYRDDMTDSAKWVECDYCNKWEHFDCELQKGKTYSTVQQLNDVKHYMCPICRNKKNGQKNIDTKIQKKLINKKRKGDVFEDQKLKKNQRKDLRNLKSEKYSELMEDMELIESFIKGK